MNHHRFDNRTKQEFANDIKEYHIVEAQIAIRIGVHIKQTKGYWPTIVPNGIDYTGKLIKSTKDVDIRPDYIIDNALCEITHSTYFVKQYFHQKCGKIKAAIKNKHSIVFVNGFACEKPIFIMMDHKFLELATLLAYNEYGITGLPTKNGMVKKDCFRYKLEWFSGMWQQLPATNNIPKLYKQILKDVGWQKE